MTTHKWALLVGSQCGLEKNCLPTDIEYELSQSWISIPNPFFEMHLQNRTPLLEQRQQHCVNKSWGNITRIQFNLPKSPDVTRVPKRLSGAALTHKMEQDLILHLDIASPPVALCALFNQPFNPFSVFCSPANLLFHSLISHPEYIAVYLRSFCQASVACLCWGFRHYFTLISRLIWSCLSVL